LLKAVSLADACEAALLIRKKIAQGIDPVAERQVTPTFRKAAEMVHEEHQKAWKNGKYQDQWIATLKSYAFPKMDDRLVSEIEGPRIRDVLAPIWLTKPQTARRVRQRIGSLEHQWGQGRELLTDKSILVVDEAGMICTRQLERVIADAERCGARSCWSATPNSSKRSKQARDSVTWLSAMAVSRSPTSAAGVRTGDMSRHTSSLPSEPEKHLRHTSSMTRSMFPRRARRRGSISSTTGTGNVKRSPVPVASSSLTSMTR
jgi:hypothetical protein